MNFLRKHYKKILIILLLIILFLSLLLGFLILPDILFYIRNKIIACESLKNIVSNNFDAFEYTKTMISPTLMCITITISILAFRVSNLTGSIQKNKQKHELIVAASEVSDFLKTNMRIMYELSTNTGNIEELVLNDHVYKEYAAILFVGNIIKQEHYAYLITIINEIAVINRYHQNSDTKEKITIDNFCNKYFEIGTIEHKKELETVIKKLDSIIK